MTSRDSLSSQEPLLNPIWILRVAPILVTVLLMIAFATSNFPRFQHETIHGLCLGLATGMMIPLTVFITSIKSVTMKNTPQPSDVQSYRLT